MPPLQRKAKQSSGQCKSRQLLRFKHQSFAQYEGKDTISFDAHNFAGWIFKSVLLVALIMVLSGCEVTDPYWQAREINPQSAPPYEPAPPYQWQFMGIPNK
jgi:hypothetical protein